MPETITEGVSNDGSQEGIQTQEGGQGQEDFNASEIYNQEIERLTNQENQNQRSATDFNAVNTGDNTGETTGDSGEDSGETTGEGGEEGSENPETNLENSSEEQESESPESEVENKKQRNDWKKEALESRNTIKSLEERLSSLEQKVTPEANNDGAADKKAKQNIPEIPSVEDFEMTQETKDLLEYTPGLDKLIENMALKTATALIEKIETDRAEKLHTAEESKAAEEMESSYWTDMDTWFSEQYPELSLSEIRNDPDFTDWMEYRKNWVDTQLGGVERHDVSGAQKVFERYITENNLAQSSEKPEEDHKRLAAARSPSVSKKTTVPTKSSGNLFDQEVAKLKNKPNATRYI